MFVIFAQSVTLKPYHCVLVSLDMNQLQGHQIATSHRLLLAVLQPHLNTSLGAYEWYHVCFDPTS